MPVASNFTYGPVTAVLAIALSCLGAFLSLRCAARAMACTGASRARWMALAAVAFGSTAIWVMHFTAMLGYTIRGETILYNVPVTLLSMVLAVAAAGIGLFAVAFGGGRRIPLLAGGLVGGTGIGLVHYLDMAGMRMPAGMTGSPALYAVSVLVAVAAFTALLWSVPRLHGAWPTLGVALIAGAVISGLHYAEMARMRLSSPGSGAMSGMAGAMAHDGATATGFLLPLIIGISVGAFLLTATVALSPNAAQMREETLLMERLGRSRPGGQHAWRPESGPGAAALPAAATTPVLDAGGHRALGRTGSGRGPSDSQPVFTRSARPAPSPVAESLPAEPGVRFQSEQEYARLMSALRDLVGALREADPLTRSLICRQLGLQLADDPKDRLGHTAPERVRATQPARA